MTTTVMFSELLRHPNDVVAQLETGDVLLTRREGESLRLSKAGPAEEEIGTLMTLTRLISASLDDEALDRITGRLEGQFPWMYFLPVPARRDFVAEFLRTSQACASIGRFGQLTILLSAWVATAEAHADQQIRPDGSDLQYLTDNEVSVVADPRSGT